MAYTIVNKHNKYYASFVVMNERGEWIDGTVNDLRGTDKNKLLARIRRLALEARGERDTARWTVTNDFGRIVFQGSKEPALYFGDCIINGNTWYEEPFWSTSKAQLKRDLLEILREATFNGNSSRWSIYDADPALENENDHIIASGVVIRKNGKITYITTL